MTQVINIKELSSEPPFAIIDEKDVRHEMKPTTVQMFIDNITMVEKMGVDSSAKDEMEAMIGIILSSFPTLTNEAVRGWELAVLQNISDMARGIGGEIATTDEEKSKEDEKSGNDQKAN